jgi:hypothetical protein
MLTNSHISAQLAKERSRDLRAAAVNLPSARRPRGAARMVGAAHAAVRVVRRLRPAGARAAAAQRRARAARV